MSEVEYPKCGWSWCGRDGKEHSCELPEGHVTGNDALTCICDCGERKWRGRSLPKKWMPRRRTARGETIFPHREL
jgi:hypothetical protein